MTDLKRLAELAGLTELKQTSPYVELDQAVNAALSYYNDKRAAGSLEQAVQYAAREYKVDYNDLLATTQFYLKHPEKLKADDVEESTPVSADYVDSMGVGRLNHEIAWIKKKIISLQPKFERRPRTIREIRDLERQIKERGGTPDVHDWLPNNIDEDTNGFIAGDRVRHIEQDRTGTVVIGYEDGETAVSFDDEPGEIYYVDYQTLEIYSDADFTPSKNWPTDDTDDSEDIYTREGIAAHHFASLSKDDP